MTNCAALRDPEKTRSLGLPILKGEIGGRELDVMRDIGYEGVVVSKQLVEASQLTGECCLLQRIDNTAPRRHPQDSYLNRLARQLRFDFFKFVFVTSVKAALVLAIVRAGLVTEGEGHVTSVIAGGGDGPALHNAIPYSVVILAAIHSPSSCAWNKHLFVRFYLIVRCTLV
ncbi:hypothetical protein PoB_002713400 [Plakobranchus ocellatus]|uniref:ATP phosphoribosyltransferase n=1 Tax=Plakobranchus ocellatus TaxID=259542 RepID=A0AAV4A361_9GAST|nr:hypothetical protein PoB_002713400 [Plakobranchus ocellatus]